MNEATGVIPPESSALTQGPVPEPTPTATVESSPVPTAIPDPAPSQELPPVEVVSVDELVDRLITGTESAEMQPPVETSPAIVENTEEPLVEAVESGPMEIVGMGQVLAHLQTLTSTADHPLLETPFDEYTVTEGLLLILVLLIVVSWCVKMVKGGFSWLLS